jgi:hypothetical protein
MFYLFSKIVLYFPIETTGGLTVGGIFGGIWDFLNGMEFEPSGGSPTLQQQ